MRVLLSEQQKEQFNSDILCYVNRSSPHTEGPLLLCLSQDPTLLATRSLVLATRYRVCAVSVLGDLEALPTSCAFQLLVLCHTLTVDECAWSLCVALRRWPDIKVLSLTQTVSESAPCERDLTVAASRGPDILLQCVADLIQWRNTTVLT